MKKKTLLMSILTVVMCLSLTIGGTFALFTSESELDIAVNSGKVAISATIDQASVATKELYDTDYTAGANNMYEGVATFTTEGLTLEKFVPGDGIKFNIIVRNDSNVTVKYRTVIECKEDDGLFSGLIVNIGDKQNYDGVRYIAIWETLSEYSADIIVPVAIELPEGAGNEYQGKKCIINYFVEAVQGNAETFNEVYAEEEITVDPTTNTTTQGVNIGTGSASAKIGAGAKADYNADSFALSITNADPNTGSFALDGSEGKLGLDIKIGAKKV
jgi:predicted ribosomally synthesized peptide with SipW-like signal peptide